LSQAVSLSGWGMHAGGMFKVGDEVPVYMIREDRDGNLVLSISRALAERDWERAEDLMQQSAHLRVPG
jgi:small subunit ribosomal protein S1